VKGGENVNVVMIRDLAHVVDREKARIGVFITLIEPTGPMKKEPVKAGFYETSFGKYTSSTYAQRDTRSTKFMVR
jgi:hypothetical protein